MPGTIIPGFASPIQALRGASGPAGAGMAQNAPAFVSELSSTSCRHAQESLFA